MSKCTAKQAVDAMLYWVGYYEKASSSYAQTRAKSAFTKNKGSNNYTYAGYKCGTQGQAWCAAQVTTAIAEACGSTADAKTVMWGVYPYVNCAQLWDAAPSGKKIWSYYQRWTKGKGERTTYYPKAGDVIVFSDNGTSRSHTGMVYGISADKKYVYTIEGNSGQMCRKRSYLLTSSYIYGWVRPNYAEGKDPDVPVEQYGQKLSIGLHQLSKGNAGKEVETLQILLNRKYDAGLDEDGDFGKATEAAVIAFKGKEWPGSSHNGIVGAGSWNRLLGVE